MAIVEQTRLISRAHIHCQGHEDVPADPKRGLQCRRDAGEEEWRFTESSSGLPLSGAQRLSIRRPDNVIMAAQGECAVGDRGQAMRVFSWTPEPHQAVRSQQFKGLLRHSTAFGCP